MSTSITTMYFLSRHGFPPRLTTCRGKLCAGITIFLIPSHSGHTEKTVSTLRHSGGAYRNPESNQGYVRLRRSLYTGYWPTPV
ncbi:MAG: hypothetical protein ACKVHQ_07070 [Gammaproteobacteria bacterium]